MGFGLEPAHLVSILLWQLCPLIRRFENEHHRLGIFLQLYDGNLLENELLLVGFETLNVDDEILHDDVCLTNEKQEVNFLTEFALIYTRTA